MPKSEFLGRHFKCDVCGKEVAGRSDHNELFKGWSEITKLDLFYGHQQCKILCPACSDLEDLVIVELFPWSGPTNPPLEQPKGVSAKAYSSVGELLKEKLFEAEEEERNRRELLDHCGLTVFRG